MQGSGGGRWDILSPSSRIPLVAHPKEVAIRLPRAAMFSVGTLQPQGQVQNVPSANRVRELGGNGEEVAKAAAHLPPPTCTTPP